MRELCHDVLYVGSILLYLNWFVIQALASYCLILGCSFTTKHFMYQGFSFNFVFELPIFFFQKILYSDRHRMYYFAYFIKLNLFRLRNSTWKLQQVRILLAHKQYCLHHHLSEQDLHPEVTYYFSNYLLHAIQVTQMLQQDCYFENSMNDLQTILDYFETFVSSMAWHASLY